MSILNTFQCPWGSRAELTLELVPVDIEDIDHVVPTYSISEPFVPNGVRDVVQIIGQLTVIERIRDDVLPNQTDLAVPVELVLGEFDHSIIEI